VTSQGRAGGAAPLVQVVVGSTRPGRVGRGIAEWAVDGLRAAGLPAVALVDLAEVDLPMYDEPHSPRSGRYEHEHTRRWSHTVAGADGYVLVTPEYNHAPNAALKNALDYLFHEWCDKPVAFVSYGGVSGGIRAVQILKQVVLSLRMRPVTTAVHVPAVSRRIDGDGRFVPEPDTVAALDALAAELGFAVGAGGGIRSA
jgi:NAD(P)H-dependent FMN reductase